MKYGRRHFDVMHRALTTSAVLCSAVQGTYRQCNRTERNQHGLVFDKLTNAQAVMHYSRHRLTAITVKPKKKNLHASGCRPSREKQEI